MICLDKIDQLPDDKIKELYYKVKACYRTKSEQSYYYFLKQAWKVIEPETYFVDNWHIKYLCDIIQKEVERIARNENKTRDIIINIPPRSTKSYLVTIMLTPWIWCKYPHFKIINSSFSSDLSTKHCLDSRRLIDSEWYKGYWGHKFKLTTDMNTKSWYENSQGGMRKSTSTGAQVTGTGGDIIIVDDAQDPEKAESDAERATVKRHYGKTLYSRLNNQKVGLRIIIQQRLHEEDLTGHLMANNPERYDFYCLPAEMTDDVSPPELKENYLNGLMDPIRLPQDVLEEARLPTNLGAYGYSGQMLQRPSPPEGGIFKRYWWKFWKADNTKLEDIVYKNEKGDLIKCETVIKPLEFDQVIDSWDTALEGELTSDDVVGGKWAKKGAQKFLLAQMLGKMDFPTTKKNVKELWGLDSNTSAILIEKSANGPAVKADLENELPGIITIPTGRLSKEDRVKMSDTVPYSAQVEAGNVFLPHPQIAPWVLGFIEEHANFPKTAQDGQVDQSSQGINYLTTKKNIWPFYQSMSKEHHSQFRLKWTQYSYNIGGIYLSNDMKISFIVTMWDRVKRHLYVYGELISVDLAPHQIASRMFIGAQMEFHSLKGVFCNSAMVKSNDRLAKTTARILNEEIRAAHKVKHIKYNTYIKEPWMYDRMGAINIVNLMFSRGMITVHENCKEVSRQFGSWYYEKDKPADKGFELCEAFTQIVSELNRTEKLKQLPAPGLKDYQHKVPTEPDPLKFPSDMWASK